MKKTTNGIHWKKEMVTYIFSETSSKMCINSSAKPNLRYSGDTVKAVTWPCHNFPLPSAFPITISILFFVLNFQEKNSFLIVSSQFSILIKLIDQEKYMRKWKEILIEYASGYKYFCLLYPMGLSEGALARTK